MTLTQKDRTILGIVVAAFFIAMAVLTYVADDEESVSDSDKKEVVERADSISNELKKEKEKTDDQNYVIRQPLEEDPFKKLDELIGMENVKEEVRALANYVKVQKQRADQGLKTPKLSYHLVFTGSPGTGKTTVARIVATIYHNIGILKKGHTIETDRSGLVAEYVGQTAIKTNKIIDAALNGVLFIDEAYSLVPEQKGSDYGQEAISTLLKRMEDDRDSLVVIIAGYNNEMKRFIDSNPGLQSRFNRYIHFNDYSTDELYQMFTKLYLKKNQYTITDEAAEYLHQQLDYAVAHKDKNFGNARYVRNMFEKAIQEQANRISKNMANSRHDLTEITKEDLEKAFK